MSKTKRTFSLDIIRTDNFLEMSHDAQLLYFHLAMRADDEGFITSPNAIIRSVMCTMDDLEELKRNGYVISFKTGVIVIKHWKKHNNIRKERIKSGGHKELEQLNIVDNIYYLKNDNIKDNNLDSQTTNINLTTPIQIDDNYQTDVEQNNNKQQTNDCISNVQLSDNLSNNLEKEPTLEEIVNLYNEIYELTLKIQLEECRDELEKFVLKNHYTKDEYIYNFNAASHNKKNDVKPYFKELINLFEKINERQFAKVKKQWETNIINEKLY